MLWEVNRTHTGTPPRETGFGLATPQEGDVIYLVETAPYQYALNRFFKHGKIVEIQALVNGYWMPQGNLTLKQAKQRIANSRGVYQKVIV